MKKLLYFLIPLFLFIPKANADIIGSEFMNTNNNAVAKDHYSSGEEHTYIRNYVLVDNEKEVFFGYTFCATGSYEFTIPTDIEGSSVPIGIYDSGVRCNTDQSGYYGTSYTFYFAVLHWHDAGNGNSSVMFNLHLRNPESYSSLISGFGVFVADYIPASVQYQKDYDGSFNTLNSKLNQVASNQNTLSSQQQQILQQQQAIIAEQENTTQAVEDVNDTLNNDTIDDNNTTGTLEDLSENLPTNSVISDLLLLPVRLFQNIVNSINGSCSPFNLGSLYGSNLTLPCINIESLIGSTLWSVIDILFCGAFVLIIRKKFVDIFHNLTDLRNGGNELE